MRLRVALLALVIAVPCGQAAAYSVLTHEEIIDLLWDHDIQPLLVQRFPGLAGDQLREARAYAYGGSVIQDLGYYPFGSREFSDLVHYVRSGDFVRELIVESRDANEFAFALGALAHFAADTNGHPAVNRSVPIEFPKLRKKYGDVVTYAQNRAAHLKCEFGFDVAQVAKRRYASKQYHDFVGFQVAKPLLERVFPRVYGLELKDVLTHEDLAIGSYRRAISTVIPKMTQAALMTRHDVIVKDNADFSERKFLYRISRADYEREWGKNYAKPGIGTKILAFLLRIVPKVGPFRGLDFKGPTPQTDHLYFESINTTLDRYRELLRDLHTEPTLRLVNRDLDTANLTEPAEYPLADDAYSGLVRHLADRRFDLLSPDLRDNVLRFFANASAPLHTKRNRDKWKKTEVALSALKSATPAAPAAVAADQR